MDTIIKDNAAAGFPANIEFVNFLDKQFKDMYSCWEDDERVNDDHIVKGVRIIKTPTTISLTKGIIQFSGEVFLFAGAVLDTTDIGKIELYVKEEVNSQVFGDLITYPAYKYRTLLARVSETGNFTTFNRNRSYVTPIRETGKNIVLSNLSGTLTHGDVVHHRDKVTINATFESMSAGYGEVRIFPFVAGQEIFDVYSRSSFRTYNHRIAGKFRTIVYSYPGDNIAQEISGDIVQEHTLFYFYNDNGRRLQTSDITGTLLPLRPAIVMIEFDIIIS